MSDELVPVKANGELTPFKSNEMNPVNVARRVFTSLDVSTDSGRIALSRAMNMADMSSEDVINKPLDISHVVCHPVSIADDKTGEVSDCIRTVLIRPNGESVGFVSIGVWSTLGVIFGLFGLPPWNPPRYIRVVQRKARRIGSVLLLEACEKP